MKPEKRIQTTLFPGENNNQTAVQRNYKDSLFRMVFSDKKELLVLYNAMRESHYTDPDLLEIKTLENAIYMTIKNDLSFLIDFRLYLYEHQSSVSPNLPLRDLFYVADQLQELIRKEDLYKSTLVRIPTPEFVVFYNGVQKQPERKILRLSDAFIKETDAPKLELEVTVLNINVGYNQKLMDACKTLRDYSLYVEKVREFIKSMKPEAAVAKAVEECIHDDILKDFLLSQRAEAIKVTIYEYDQAQHEETLREEGRTEGELLKVIKLIIEKRRKQLTVPVIAEHLEEKEEFVTRVCEVIEANPEAAAEEILEKIN
ncbi:MAG: hypothetical protein PHE06_11190 [Lachnospiraceae bacterium]|nr:hypothetical protein [Lachnospiraceae bacterium]